MSAFGSRAPILRASSSSLKVQDMVLSITYMPKESGSNLWAYGQLQQCINGRAGSRFYHI
jgi:hypothetical protein